VAQVKTKVRGEYTNQSEYSEVPDGALKSGKNVNIDRDSLAEPRRGYNNYKSISASGTDRASAFTTYRDTILSHFGTTLARDTADPQTAYVGTITRPNHGDSYVPRMKFVEANSNLYFPADDGVKKLDSLTSTVINSGAPRGLDLNLALTGVSGFMTNSTQVAYRLVWLYEDLNKNLIIGSPSQRAVISNSSGSTQDVIVNFSVPQEVTTSWFYRLYRSGLTPDVNTDPNDELQLVYEGQPTSGEISALNISITDSTPEALRGEALYTNDSQEGIAQSNDTPPAAKDIALFKTCAFLANTIQKQSRNLTLLSAGGASGVHYSAITGDITLSSTTVATLSSTTGLTAGQSITGTGIPAGTTILSVNTGASTLVMSAAATATTATLAIETFDTITIAGIQYLAAGTEDTTTKKFKVFTSGTTAQNIADTAQSLCKVINRYASNTAVYAYYDSNFDELPGQIFLEARALGASSFAIIASSHGTAWSPALPTSGVTVSSDAEERKNRLHVSKLQRPEAFPRAQYYPVGAQDKAILRILPLRESLIILKEDGAYRLTGNTPADFQIDPLDTTLELEAPESAVILNNQIFAFTNQVIVTITDSSVGVISRPIEDQLSPLLDYTNLATTCFAIAYESDRKYMLWVPTTEDDTYAQKCHVYNVFTQAWTHHDKPASAGFVNKADDKIYLGSDLTNKILQERKDRDYTDFADEDIAVTLSSGEATTTITLVDASDIDAGDILTQGSEPWSIIESADQTTGIITINVARNFSAGAATVKKMFECEVVHVAAHCGNPGAMKQVREVHPLLKEALFVEATMTFSTDLVYSEDSVTIEGFPSFLWGFFDWGDVPWGGYSGLFKDRAYITKEHQRNTWLNTTFKTSHAYAYFALAGHEYTYELLSERTGS
jgi:hypothetical protein